MGRTFENLEEFKAAAGEELGTSDWIEVTQEKINLFADSTGDHQWIHVDPEMAAKGPFGGTIAHGYFTLSLLPVIAEQAYSVGNLIMGLNYGANKVRYPHPVLVGKRVRGTATLIETAEIAIGTQATIKFVIEIEGVDKPACVAEVLYVMKGI
ncbi:MAG: MaoC family dehydratase [Aeromicrobium sp.]|jgi:acyl dehydratase|uniref:Acyl dehydratase n=1 Tax=uncultured bacterium A1Q1_fos_1060 TaxID=1256540 RepID=L7VYQ6_9BACT|nr:acyl dehydratase [uncultured bacterium A1Q1_fos_1060]TXJ07283.1 MAG: MaoC family dehydratase [Aeromicrobium sp.]